MSNQVPVETFETIGHAHALFMLDSSGHPTPLVWDAVEEAEAIVAQAALAFTAHLGRGGWAYEMDRSGGGKTMVRTFDPLAERTVLSPRLIGG